MFLILKRIAYSVPALLLLLAPTTHAQPPSLEDIASTMAETALVISATSGQTCAGERPANIGCSVACKPCLTYICQAGVWVPLSLDWPERLCEVRPNPFPRPGACVGTDSNGFCPAECSVCL